MVLEKNPKFITKDISQKYGVDLEGMKLLFIRKQGFHIFRLMDGQEPLSQTFYEPKRKTIKLDPNFDNDELSTMTFYILLDHFGEVTFDSIDLEKNFWEFVRKNEKDFKVEHFGYGVDSEVMFTLRENFDLNKKIKNFLDVFE